MYRVEGLKDLTLEMTNMNESGPTLLEPVNFSLTSQT